MITDYSNFDYNINFLYNHNIFKKWECGNRNF